jgi:hypothetical protein
MSRDDDDRALLAAYVDGVSELDVDERRRVDELLAREPALRGDADATRALIARLRALPLEGREPNPSALAHAIHDAVGPGVPARPWWRRAAWLAPIGAVATIATIAVLWSRHPAEPPSPPSAPIVDAGAAPSLAPATTLWLDGEIVDVDALDPAALDELDGDARDALADEGDEPTGELLPTATYDWIDRLDDRGLDRAERWLDRKKS